MNVQERANQQEDAQKIWDELDAEDVGNAPKPADSPDTTADAADAAPVLQAPAEQADATQQDEELTPRERALMDKLTGMETVLSQVQSRLRNAEGHIGGLGSQLKQTLQTAQQVVAKGGDAPSASEIREAQKTPEKMQALKRDYPEFGDALESALNERMSGLEQRLQAQAAPVQQQPSITPQDIQRIRSELQVEVRHPGWQGRVQTPEFVGWLQRQPREVQMLAASESPQDAVRLLDLHSESTKPVTSQRTQRLNSAAAIPTGRSGSTGRQKAVEDMTPEEFWRYQDELDRQKGN